MISSNGSKYFLLLFALFTICFVSCQNQPKLKSFNNVITADDSLNIELLEDEQMEVFLNDDLSLSFMEQRLYKGDDIFRTPGQQLMGMGAELLEAGDDYSLHTGQDGDFEYYAKVIDDSTRIVTIILRYLPDRADAAEGLKQYVHDYALP